VYTEDLIALWAGNWYGGAQHGASSSLAVTEGEAPDVQG